MRILLSAFQCSPRWGSEPGSGWHWATQLARMGHEVTVLTIPEMREDILAAEPEPAIDFQFIDLPGTRLRRVSDSLATYTVYRRWQDAAFAHVRGRGGEFDVAHHVTWGGLHLGSQLWRLPVPLIYGPIGGGQTAPPGYRRYFGRDWPAELARTASTGPLLTLNNRCRQTVRNAAVTLVCNSATAAACRRLGAADVRFMMADGLPPEAVGAARAQPAGTPVILYVGRLIARKAPALAVEAFAEYRRTAPGRLLVAGHGPLRAEVEALARRLGVADDVELLGNLPLAKVRELYDSASALLFTSLRESFGSPILEALGRGLPVVALSLHGIADADTGEAVQKVPLPAVPAELPGRLGAALRTVLGDGGWQSRSARGIKFAADWTWPVKAAMATELYRELTR